jgi:hypothetical protein
MTTNLVRQMWRGVLEDWARSVRWHVFEYLPQSLDNVIIIDFAAGNPGT